MEGKNFMAINDDWNSNWEKKNEGINNMLKQMASTLKPLNDNVEIITQGIRGFGKKISESFKPLDALYNTDTFDNLRKSFKYFSDGIVLYRLESLGSLGWCNIDTWIKEPSDSNISFSDKIVILHEEDHYEIDKIDRYIGLKFTKDILQKIETDTLLLLDNPDSEKLKKAMINFRARRYLESANLLASLIDAQNIKQELFDINHNKYSLENCDKKNGKPNVSQGWRAFYIVFNNNFSTYFDGEKIKGKSNQARQESFNNFVQNIKGKLPANENIVAIISLSFCLLKIFEDSDFTHYPNYIPEVINRHWLMHGMYKIKDITRYDCIKLFLILNQISFIYSKLKNGEL